MMIPANPISLDHNASTPIAHIVADEMRLS